MIKQDYLIRMIQEIIFFDCERPAQEKEVSLE